MFSCPPPCPILLFKVKRQTKKISAIFMTGFLSFLQTQSLYSFWKDISSWIYPRLYPRDICSWLLQHSQTYMASLQAFWTTELLNSDLALVFLLNCRLTGFTSLWLIFSILSMKLESGLGIKQRNQGKQNLPGRYKENAKNGSGTEKAISRWFYWH